MRSGALCIREVVESMHYVISYKMRPSVRIAIKVCFHSSRQVRPVVPRQGAKLHQKHSVAQNEVWIRLPSSFSSAPDRHG